MFTQSHKGQEQIGFAIMFGLTLIIGLFLMVMLEDSGESFSGTAEAAIGAKIDDVRTRSAVEVVMVDELWRSDEIDYEDYGDLSGYKAISYYFSTSGDSVYIGGEETEREDFRQDLENYIGQRLNDSFVDGPNQVDYYFEARAGDEEIVVHVNGDERSPKWARIGYPLALADGGEARINLWTKTENGIFAVS